MRGRDLRGSVHDVFERGEDVEEPLGDYLEVAVTQIVHEINISKVNNDCGDRAVFGNNHRCQEWD